MIFWTWRSYFIRWQIFENKVWCPVSKKRTKYFHFLLSLAYPIDRLDWALFSVVILFHHFFPLLEKVEIRVFILPRNFPAVLIIFTGRGGEPPLPRRAGRPSLVFTNALGYREWPRPLTKHTADIFGKGSMPWVLHFSRQSLIPWGPQLGSWPAHTDTGSWPLPLSDILGPPVQSRSSDISLARPRSW